MSLTKAQADTVLVRRNRGYLSQASMSVAVDGTNPDTVDALRAGLSSLGVSPAALADVTDSDLAPLTSSQLDQFYDVADLQLKRDLLGSLMAVDQRISLGEQKLSQGPDRLLALITALEKRLRDCYGIGAGTVSGGAVDYGFAQTDPCDSTPLWGW